MRPRQLTTLLGGAAVAAGGAQQQSAIPMMCCRRRTARPIGSGGCPYRAGGNQLAARLGPCTVLRVKDPSRSGL
jgi:hypothetical protein